MRFVADWQQAHPRESLAEFVAYLDIYQQVGGDLDAEQQGRVEVEGVQLMTIYQAKGLEYEAVVVPRLVEGQFPDTRDEQLLHPGRAAQAEAAGGLRHRRGAAPAVRGHDARQEPAAAHRAPAAGVRRSSPAASSASCERGGGDEPVSSDEFVRVVPHRRRSSSIAPPGHRRKSRRVAAVTAAESAPETTVQLLKLMPVPLAHERRFALRRRAVEIMGMLEGLAADDHAGRAELTRELVEVAEDAAGAADGGAAQHGLDPLTLDVVSRHAPAGQTLLELASLPPSFSHSQLRTYSECPLQYAFDKRVSHPGRGDAGLLRVRPRHPPGVRGLRARAPRRGRRGPARARLRDAAGRRSRRPGSRATSPTRRPRATTRTARSLRCAASTTARWPAWRRPWASRSASRCRSRQAPEEPPVLLYGVIDRIDRHPDGSIEITDYKTGRRRTRRTSTRDEQLSAYALAMAIGAVLDPETKLALPPATKLTLYFTETDQALSTTRTPEQLDAFRQQVIARRAASARATSRPLRTVALRPLRIPARSAPAATAPTAPTSACAPRLAARGGRRGIRAGGYGLCVFRLSSQLAHGVCWGYP